MRKIMLGVVTLLIAAVGASAQDYPKVEVFGGYSYGNFGPTVLGSDRTNVNGWNASAAVNFNHWFGVVSDIGGHYGDFKASVPLQPLPCAPPNCNIETTGTNKYHNFLFGPQFTMRKEKLSVFGHFLVGASHLNESGTTTIPGPVPPLPPPPFPLTFNFSTSSTSYAFGTGGGADYKLTERVAWRVQADYVGTQFHDRTQGDVRVSTGLVFRF
jgi:opacity protein-like surface antigen